MKSGSELNGITGDERRRVGRPGGHERLGGAHVAGRGRSPHPVNRGAAGDPRQGAGLGSAGRRARPRQPADPPAARAGRRSAAAPVSAVLVTRSALRSRLPPTAGAAARAGHDAPAARPGPGDPGAAAGQGATAVGGRARRGPRGRPGRLPAQGPPQPVRRPRPDPVAHAGAQPHPRARRPPGRTAGCITAAADPGKACWPAACASGSPMRRPS